MAMRPAQIPSARINPATEPQILPLKPEEIEKNRAIVEKLLEYVFGDGEQDSEVEKAPLSCAGLSYSLP